MHMLIELTYGGASMDKLSDEDWAELVAAFPGLPNEKPRYVPYNTILLTDENKHLLAKHDLGFKISDKQAEQGIGYMVVKLQDRIRAIEGKTKNLVALESQGAAVQIHVPDFTLMNINEVQVLDDACTDYLQTQLDDGWRILAVCPPNAARRPDYILGRNRGRVQDGGCR